MTRKLSGQMEKVPIKRRSARLSAKLDRESTEKSETKMGTVQSNEDKMDTTGMSSDEPFQRSNTDACERQQLSIVPGDSFALDSLNISGFSSADGLESEQVPMEEDTDTEKETNAALTGTQPPQLTSEEPDIDDFLSTPPAPPSSPLPQSSNVEEIAREEHEAEKGDDGDGVEVIESVTTTGVNGTAWWQTSRMRKRLTSTNGEQLEANIVTYQSVRKTNHPFQSVVHEAIQQSKNDFRPQPRVLEYLHETSEAHFMPFVEDAHGETGVGFVIHNHTTQQVFEETTNNDSHNSSGSSLQDFLGYPPSPQFSDEENDYDGGDEVSAEIQEQEKSDEPNEEPTGEVEEVASDHSNEIESSTTVMNGARWSQTSQRRLRPRKQLKPKKRKDRVTREIIKFQSGTKLLIPRLPFQRVVREVMKTNKNDYRLQEHALECLREASEAYLVQLFEDSNLACFHRSRITLGVKDMRLVQIIRGAADPGQK